MPYRKTDKARQLLQAHDGQLGLRERRLLILCDGQRSPADLARLFGEDVAPVLRQLRALGLIEDDGGPAGATPAPMAQAPKATPAPAAVRPAPAPAAAPAPTPASAQPAGPRRSLVAAKMYVLDMLQLQRGEEASALRNQVQASREPDAMLVGFSAALRFIARTSASSLAERVHQRLLEVLPEEHLPALRRLDA